MTACVPIPLARTLLHVPDLFLPASVAARVLGISVRKLYRMVDEKALVPAGFLDGEMRFRFTQLEDLVVSGTRCVSPRIRAVMDFQNHRGSGKVPAAETGPSRGASAAPGLGLSDGDRSTGRRAAPRKQRQGHV